MLNLKGLAQMFVIDATAQGHSAAAIEAAVEEFLAPLRSKEERHALEKSAKELTFEAAEDILGRAMSEFWEGDDIDELEAMLRIRFPKHPKKIDKILDLAGDASNEREDMGKNGPSKEYEELYDKVIKALKKLPW